MTDGSVINYVSCREGVIYTKGQSFVELVATFLGCGLVTNTFAAWLSWQGYRLDPLGLGPKDNGPWTFANLGVLVALVVGFLGQFLLARGRVAKQESA